MKAGIKSAGKCVLCLAVSAALLYGGRVLAYFLMSKLFAAENMTPDTCAYAPEWLRYIWNRAGDIADLTALILCFGGLLYLRRLSEPENEVLMGTHLFLGVMGALVGIMLVSLLESADCLRGGLAGGADALDWALQIFICACCAVLLRGCVSKNVYSAFGTTAACAVSAVLQAAVFCLAAGGFNILLTVNGLITGAVFAYVYIRHRSLLPEVFMCAGMRIGARCVMGFPDIKRYPVSENLLTGGHAGLEASLALTLIFALAGAMCAILIKKGRTNGK